MLRGQTLAFKGDDTVDVIYTNSDGFRYTVNAAVNGLGDKIPV